MEATALIDFFLFATWICGQALYWLFLKNHPIFLAESAGECVCRGAEFARTLHLAPMAASFECFHSGCRICPAQSDISSRDQKFRRSA
jgi:hypothetical protein